MEYKDVIQQLRSSRDFLGWKLRKTKSRDVLLENLAVVKSISNLKSRYENVNS